MNLFIRISRMLLASALFLAVAGSLHAQVFAFEFDGINGSIAKAVGTISFDPLTFKNEYNFDSSGGPYSYDLPNPTVLDLSVTVTGASDAAANGVFGTADFWTVTWNPNGALDLSQPLVGQTPNGNPNLLTGTVLPWGTPNGGGDFSFVSAGVAPSAFNTPDFGFEVTTLGGIGGDTLKLVSMAAVPEPSNYAAMAGAVALLFVVARRIRRS